MRHLSSWREGPSRSLVGVTVGDEVMVFLSLRLLRGALSPLQELLVFLEGCARHIGIESLLCGPAI